MDKAPGKMNPGKEYIHTEKIIKPALLKEPASFIEFKRMFFRLRGVMSG